MRTFEGSIPKVYPELVREVSNEEPIGSRYGGTKEILGVAIRSQNPRHRMMFRPNINWAFGMQECFAYWNGRNPGHVERYNSRMEEFMYPDSDGVERLHGSAYGRYLREIPHDQISRVIDQLSENEDTRRAVINIHQAGVEDYDKGDVACTVYLHLIVRDGKLNMIACLRSQDLLWGLPYDQQAFQWIQEVLAGILDLELGWYEHRMNSCHYYLDREDEVMTSADQCSAIYLPDCRLPTSKLTPLMRNLDTGLSHARDGRVPVAQLMSIEKHSSFYADWLGMMTAYEQARFHDDPERAHDIMEHIETNAFATVVQRYLSSI